MLVKKTMYYMVDPDSSREEALLKGNVSANCNVGLPTAGEGDKTTMRPFVEILRPHVTIINEYYESAMQCKA